MQTPTNLQLAIQFARRRIGEGLSFDDVNERTSRFLYQELRLPLIEAQVTALRAAALVDAEANSRYLDTSLSTGDTAVIANPVNGSRMEVSIRVINHALQCLAGQQVRSAAATV